MKPSPPNSSVAFPSRKPLRIADAEPSQQPVAAQDAALQDALKRAPAPPAAPVHAAERRLRHPVIVSPDPERVRKEEEIVAGWVPILTAIELGQFQKAEELGHQIGAHSLPVGSRYLADYYPAMNRQLRRLGTQTELGDTSSMRRIEGFDITPQPASGSSTVAARGSPARGGQASAPVPPADRGQDAHD